MDPATSSQTAPVIQMIPIDAIVPSPLNPRKHLDLVRLAELAASIKQQGICYPLKVRPGKKAGTFELIAGERRWTAAKNLQLTDAPCIVSECTDSQLVELALTENGQREDLTPLDEARAYQAAMKANPKHYTVAVVAGTVGKSESYVYRRLKLLGLAKPLQEALDADTLSIAHAEKLIRLQAKLQMEAADERGRGVVWRRNPLLEYNEKWVPSKEDLLPLNVLEEFIRNKSHFNPASPDTKYLQPTLVEQLTPDVDALVAEKSEDDGANDPGFDDDIRDQALTDTLSSLVELTDDPMARMRIGAKKDDKIPLTPSKWKEVKSATACEFTQRGVITHGGAARVLYVCITKRCQKHWPVKKKAKSGTKPVKSAAPQRDYWEEQQRKNKLERESFQQLLAEALPALAEFTKGVTFSAALVRIVVGSHLLDEIVDHFGVTLTDATAAHVLLLSTIRTSWRSHFTSSLKAAAPKFLPELQRIEAAQKKAAATKAKADKKGTTVAPTDAISRTVLRALDIVEGGSARVKAAVMRGAKNEELDALIKKELGSGGLMDDDFDFKTRSGQLHINKPVKRKLTVGKVREVARTLFGTAKKGKKG